MENVHVGSGPAALSLLQPVTTLPDAECSHVPERPTLKGALSSRSIFSLSQSSMEKYFPGTLNVLRKINGKKNRSLHEKVRGFEILEKQGHGKE
jgi:hypothetical protein